MGHEYEQICDIKHLLAKVEHTVVIKQILQTRSWWFGVIPPPTDLSYNRKGIVTV